MSWEWSAASASATEEGGRPARPRGPATMKACCSSTAVICLLLQSLGGAPASSGTCPAGCDCPHPQHFTCVNRGLRAVPGAVSASEDARIFSLGGNFIGSISAADFAPYTNLTRLNLQFNRIASIHPRALERLSALEELYLGHNLLTDVPAGSLQPLTKLTTLYANNNSIKKIPPELFSNLDRLAKLRLDGNAIEVLHDSVFKSLSSLHYLHLENNKVSYIHRNAFSRLTSLRFLNLSNNKQSAVSNAFTFSHLRGLSTLLLSDNEISHIGDHAFQSLRKMSRLSLSNNRISQMDSDALKGLSSLKELLLDGNKLEEIPSGLLEPLVRVEVLNFSNNRIAAVDSAAFSRLERLKVLNMRNNLLSSLSGDAFAFNNLLYDLDLHGNNWTCDCRLEDLKGWMAAAHARGKLLTVFVQCHHPAALRGKYLDHLNVSQLLPHRSNSCTAGDRDSEGGGVLVKMDLKQSPSLNGAEDGGSRAEEVQLEVGNQTKREEKEHLTVLNGDRIIMRRDGQKEGIQRDQEGPEFTESSSLLNGGKPKKEAAKRIKGRHRSNVFPKTFPSATSKPRDDPNVQPNTSSPVPAAEQFDRLRSGQEQALPVVTDPCLFNRHFITNVSVDQVTSDTVTVFWSARGHRPHTRQGSREVHYRILYDRFGTADRFPRYVYARGASHSVTLRELTPGVTYVVCVEGVVGGSVCQVAPRDHCAGLVTLADGAGRGNASLASDFQLVTVATLVSNGALLLVVGGIWLGRSLRRRLQRGKSAVHVRHMYSTRRPFRPAMTTTSVSADFTSYQSSRPPRLPPPEGNLMEFPCERFPDCGARRESSMQRFPDLN